MTIAKQGHSRAADGTAPFITADDAGVVFGLLVLTGVAWLVPPASWPAACRRLSSAARRFFSTEDQSALDRARRLRGKDFSGLPNELAAVHIERTLHLLRHDGPAAWRPRIELIGAAHIDRALNAGRGAVLWDSHFAFASLISKMGLWNAGYHVSHLSHPRHGLSASQFGMRYLNRVRTRVEERYVDERVVLSDISPAAAMRRLHNRLRDNGLVSITVRGSGRDPVTARFLDGPIAVATGAPDLAHMSGAALLPVFTVRRPDGSFGVTVEAPIEVDRDGPRRAASADAVHAYLHRLERHVVGQPGQWLGWMDA